MATESASDVYEFLVRTGFNNSVVCVGDHRDIVIELVSDCYPNKQFRHTIRVREKGGLNWTVKYLGMITITKFPNADINITFYDMYNRIVAPKDRKIVKATKTIKSALKKIYNMK